MNQNNKGKFYSYFCFDKQSKFGSIRGRIFSIKSSTYIKDGQEFKRLNFALAGNNIDKKVKYILDVEPTVSDRNPDTIFVDCVVFGTNAERLEKFLHDSDEIVATGFLSSYEGKSGNRVNLKIQDVSLIKRYGQVETSPQNVQQPAFEPSIDEDDDDEIPF